MGRQTNKSEPERPSRPRGRLRTFFVAVVWTLLLSMPIVAVRRQVAALDDVPATRSQMAAALATRGVAWVWPVSNGPRMDATPSALPYREAAVLMETLVIHADGVDRMPRTQPLVLPAGVRVLPVLHVEAAPDAPDALSSAQEQAIAAAFMRHVSEATEGAGMLQLDFEAPRRQRAAYLTLVSRLKAALPSNVKLSVTALARWCTESDWLDRLPADEVVPMLYRLGPNAARWRQRWLRGDSGLAARCQGPAIGFATNDPPPTTLLARTSRPYWFDESAWANLSQPRLRTAP